MTQLDLGRLGVWGHLDSLAAPDAIAYARRAEQLGYGTLWVPETVGREPIALLALLAGATDSINLGTSIVNIWGRDAQSARMAAQTIAEASGGRFVLGLGVSHPHLAEKLRGHRFARPLSRMREYLAAYRAAVYRGPSVDGAGEPPLMIAALRERMVDLAATDADGALPYLITTARAAWMRDRLDAAADGGHPRLAVTLPVVIGQPDDREAARAYLKPYLRTPTYQASWELQGFDSSNWESPGSDRLVDAMVAIGSVDVVRERIGAMLAAGADHVAIIPLAHDGTTENAATLEELAEA
jgi:probable F420-dependent oxidoreductase